MFADACGRFLTDRRRAGQRPWSGDHNSNQQSQESRADTAGDKATEIQSIDRLEILALVDEHDREQDQHIDRTDVDQHLSGGHEAGIEQQIQACHRHEHAPQQEC